MGSTATKSTSTTRRARRWTAFLALMVLAALLVRWQVTLSWIGGSIICSESAEHADLILVPGGDFWGPRVTKAADLARQGFASLVLISGPPYAGRPEGELAVEHLVQQGYPRDLFAVFGHRETSTIGEAMVLKAELARRHARRVILVTDAYHSRRCAIVFRKFCTGIHFISLPASDSHFHADGWWSDPGSRDLFFSEWTKILGSLVIAYPRYLLGQAFAGTR